MALTKQLAVGRLVKNKQGEFASGKHQLIATMLADPRDEFKDVYKNKLIKVMNRAKDIGDKRLRLTSTDKEFEVQVQAYNIDSNTRIVFFAITDPTVGESFDVGDILKNFQEDFLDLHDEDAIRKARSGGKVHKQSKEILKALLTKYGESKLSRVQKQVQGVKNVMEENMEQALANVTTIEQMDTDAAEMEKHAGQFKKKARVVKRNEQKRWYMTNVFFVIVVIIVIIIIISAVCGSGICDAPK